MYVPPIPYRKRWLMSSLSESAYIWLLAPILLIWVFGATWLFLGSVLLVAVVIFWKLYRQAERTYCFLLDIEKDGNMFWITYMEGDRLREEKLHQLVFCITREAGRPYKAYKLIIWSPHKRKIIEQGTEYYWRTYRLLAMAEKLREMGCKEHREPVSYSPIWKKVQDILTVQNEF